MNQLKVFVERCVRPVRAESSRKLEMRRELYGHLESVYEREREQTGSDEAAIEAAIARMGDPGELTKELNSSLSVLDRWTGTLDRLFCRTIRESPCRYAVRLTAWVFKLSLALLVPVVVVSALVAGQWGFHQQLMIRICVALVLIETIGCLIGSWFFAMLCDRLEEHGWNKQLVPLVLKIGVTLLLAVPLGGWVFVYGVSGDAATATAFLPRWILLSLLACLGVLWAAWLDAKLTRDLREWRELPIDQ